MRLPAALSPRRGGELSCDVAGFDSPRHEIVGDRDMDSGPRAAAEQHAHRPRMLVAERVHRQGDLGAIVEVGVGDVQLDIPDALDGALPVRRSTGAQQLLDAFLELAILLEQRFDAKTRTLAATLFLIQRGLSAGITIYAPAIIFGSILG